MGQKSGRNKYTGDCIYCLSQRKRLPVIVIDPLRTPTADKADILFSPKPGTDGALALAIASVLINKDMIDHEFIRNYVKGFDEFRNHYIFHRMMLN